VICLLRHAVASHFNDLSVVQQMAQGDISRFTSALHHYIDDTAGTTESAVREFISLSPLLNRFRQTPRLISLFWGNLRSCSIVTDMTGIDHEWRRAANF